MHMIQISANPYVHIVKKGNSIEIVQVGKSDNARVFDKNGNDITDKE